MQRAKLSLVASATTSVAPGVATTTIGLRLLLLIREACRPALNIEAIQVVDNVVGILTTREFNDAEVLVKAALSSISHTIC